MFCPHKPTECKQQQSKQKPKTQNNGEQKNNNSNNNSNGSNSETPKMGPKLKINNNLSTALAALDEALQNSFSLDADSEGKGFI